MFFKAALIHFWPLGDIQTQNKLTHNQPWRMIAFLRFYVSANISSNIIIPL